MYENEIIQTEERVSKLLEMINKPFVGVDIAQSQYQSAITYISNSRKLLNCKDCLYYENCDKRDADGLVYCFRKPRCVCIKCKLKSEAINFIICSPAYIFIFILYINYKKYK